MKSELTSRQWKLYNFLKDQGDNWTQQNVIAEALWLEYDMPDTDSKLFHSTGAAKEISNDVQAINSSGVIQKIILSGNKGHKLATEEEAEKYIGKRIVSAVAALNRAKLLAKKAGRDGQYRLVFGKEKEIIEAFLHS